MDRRSSTQDVLTGLRRRVRSASAALSTTDGRWAMVSTSITALVAGSMAWLAASAMPPLHTKSTHKQQIEEGLQKTLDNIVRLVEQNRTQAA